MKYITLLLSIFILLLALSCAKQTMPQGGPKDTIPPVLISSVPVNKQTNFKSQTITLTFSEYVSVNNAREQLIITPSLGKNAEMTARKKTITLKLPALPADSTTYTVNFRESVQDVTERNKAENLKLAFSSGTYIDSLFTQGTIYDALTASPLKNITVGLYTADTFNIFQHMPPYFTKGNDKGYFILENLKPDNYFVYAWDDKNKNLTVDSKTEAYGFLKDTLQLRPNIDSISLAIPLIRLDARPLRLVSARPYNTYIAIKTSKGLLEYSLEPLNPDDSLVSIYAGKEQATINVYPQVMMTDSIPVKFLAEDSINFRIDTILYVKKATRQAQPETFSVQFDKPNIYSNNTQLKTTIAFSKPITSINFDSIAYIIDSTTTVSFNQQDLTINNVNNITLTKQIDRSLLFPVQPQATDALSEDDLRKGATAPKDPAKISKLIFGKGAFISIENDTSSHTEQQVILTKQEQTSVIMTTVETSAQKFLVQLLTKNFQVVQTSINTKNIVFNNIPPGDYQIRLIIDTNGNGRWDPGNYYTRTEPEPVYYYTSEEGLRVINIKANWELGPLLITDQKDVDNMSSTP